MAPSGTSMEDLMPFTDDTYTLRRESLGPLPFHVPFNISEYPKPEHMDSPVGLEPAGDGPGSSIFVASFPICCKITIR